MSPRQQSRSRLARPLRIALTVALPLALVGGVAFTATATDGRPDARSGGARPGGDSPKQTQGPVVTGSAVLDEIPLAEFSNGLIPGSVDDDRGVHLGVGSDLYPADRPGEFWALTDRGPNGLITVDGKKRRTFPVPGFNPAIVRVKVDGERVRVLDAVPVTTRSGKPVTGLPNQLARDEAPFTYDARTALETNPNGLDTEGLVRAADGTFWLVDEYSPSLVHVSARGRVLTRYVPEGLKLRGADYPVVEALPSILLNRKQNRGFEALTVLPGGDLVIAVQSPLLVPDKAAGEASRNLRLLRFSPDEGEVTGEYAYRVDPVNVVDPQEADQSELKVSALVAVDANTVLVQERTDRTARLHRVELPRGEGILDSRWDEAATSPSYEQTQDLAGAGVDVLEKRLVVDLGKVPGVPGKVEGVALVGRDTLALINDNDFGMSDGPEAFDENGRLRDSGLNTKVTHVKLPTAIRR
ncbi:esterase-like activity of phytase family protein [Streptomyces sp. NPDC047315]|uniref:esterase-like activity of phytase family protein n=1 Tax=Streptomyces sp. NPDC047315 TaxID=3155142 RepID=UPI0033C0B0AC